MSIVQSRKHEMLERLKLVRTAGRNAVSDLGQPHGIAPTLGGIRELQ